MRGRRLVPVLLLLGGLAGCGGEPEADPVADVRAVVQAPVGEWSRLPDLPLSARSGPVVATVGGRVVVVGGFIGSPCPPNADCVYQDDAHASDGVALDADEGTWTPIAEAPVPVPDHAPWAVVGDDLHVAVEGEVLVWHGDEDTWGRIPLPRGHRRGALVAHDGSLLVVQDSDEQREQPDLVLGRDGAWSELPDDPYDASFDRAATSTPHGLVLTRHSIATLERGSGPVLVEAAVLVRGRWRELGPSDQLGGWSWTWTGRHLVDLTLGGSDGGEVDNYGRELPFGGRLDPATGTWSPLPGAPEEGSDGWNVEALGREHSASSGYLYDDSDGSWTRLPSPPASAPETPGRATWLRDVLVVVGGEDWGGVRGRPTAEKVWSRAVWLWKVG